MSLADLNDAADGYHDHMEDLRQAIGLHAVMSNGKKADSRKAGKALFRKYHGWRERRRKKAG